MEKRRFDLNIERVLENWEIEHALREIIANALDETYLAGASDILIGTDAGQWFVQDFGRGLRIEHFTMNENIEKLEATRGVIGKFGVGLKDAIATLHRHGIIFTIESPFGEFRVEQHSKSGFDGIETLHVSYAENLKPGGNGTRFLFENLPDAAVATAKAMFLKFSNHRCIESGQYGDILEREPAGAAVYIHGVRANDEPNFLFSYNITSLTEAMRKRLNRERTNVGRTTYSDRIKAMLKDASSDAVLSALAERVETRDTREIPDELKWIEVSEKALRALADRKRVVYLTEAEAIERPDIVDNAKRDGYDFVIISNQQRDRLHATAGEDGDAPLMDSYIRSYNESFQYNFVSPTDLSAAERQVLSLSNQIAALAGLKAGDIPPIKVSRTMRLNPDATLGVWDSNLGAVVINSSQLASLSSYAGTLLHELAHAKGGHPDVSRAFENTLTEYLGKVASQALDAENGKPTVTVTPPSSKPQPKHRRGFFARLFAWSSK